MGSGSIRAPGQQRQTLLPDGDKIRKGQKAAHGSLPRCRAIPQCRVITGGKADASPLLPDGADGTLMGKPAGFLPQIHGGNMQNAAFPQPFLPERRRRKHPICARCRVICLHSLPDKAKGGCRPAGMLHLVGIHPMPGKPFQNPVSEGILSDARQQAAPAPQPGNGTCGLQPGAAAGDLELFRLFQRLPGVQPEQRLPHYRNFLHTAIPLCDHTA